MVTQRAGSSCPAAPHPRQLARIRQCLEAIFFTRTLAGAVSLAHVILAHQTPSVIDVLSSGLRDLAGHTQGRVSGLRDLSVGQVRRLASRLIGEPTWPQHWGVNLIGYFGSPLGLGEAAHALLAALDARGIPAVPVHLRSASAQPCDAAVETVTPMAAPFAVNLFCLNGDGMRGFLREYGRAFFSGRYSIGVWWWEVIPAPARWTAASATLDEIWACSDHVRSALLPISHAPVLKMQEPVPFPVASAATREEIGFPPGFVFYFAFDYSSTSTRKNPVGLIRAFREAFSEHSGACLVIRSINGDRDPQGRRRIESAAAGRQDVRVIDRYVSPGTKNAMLAYCDCYVSLHRAEGFGHSLAEAMLLAKPVIATGWSGNLDFMTEANSYLVDYTMTSVGRGSWPYPASAAWAEPDLAHAARLMREVFADPDSAAARGRLAAREVGRTHGPAQVGAAIEARLNDIRPLVMAQSAAGPPAASTRGPRSAFIRRREAALRAAVVAASVRVEAHRITAGESRPIA